MTRERKLKRGSVGSVGSVGSAQLLPAIRYLYWKLPESYLLGPWQLLHVLYSLSYTDGVADEAEITAAVEVGGGTGRNGRQDEPPTWMESLYTYMYYTVVHIWYIRIWYIHSWSYHHVL